MRSGLSLALGAALALGSADARAASATCCTNWLGAFDVTCLVHDGPCAAGDTSVAIELIAGDAGLSCGVGATTCSVLPAWTCCLGDCSQQCAIDRPYEPSCCHGDCSEIIGKGGGSVDLNPQCDMTTTAEFDACCYPDRVQVPAAVGSAPGEWSVGTGTLVTAEPMPEAGPEPGGELELESGTDGVTDSGASGGCSTSGGRSPSPWLFALACGVALRARVRRRSR